MASLSVTLCLTALLFNLCSAVPTAGHVTKSEGENLTMVCTTEDPNQDGLSLYARLPEKHEISYFHKSTSDFTAYKEFSGRVNASGNLTKLMITITGLQESDTGVYSCVYKFYNGKYVIEKETESVLLSVKGIITPLPATTGNKEPSAMPEMLVLVSVLTACTVVILCLLVIGVWVVPKMKALCAGRRGEGSKAHNAVYEDMRAHRTRIAV